MNVYKGRMPTKIELTLEQSQQGVSNDVLAKKSGHTYAVRITMLIADIKDDIMDPDTIKMEMMIRSFPAKDGFINYQMLMLKHKDIPISIEDVKNP
ncbi:hypothetical protein Tco_0295745 [Tanacetum coccineum]